MHFSSNDVDWLLPGLTARWCPVCVHTETHKPSPLFTLLPFSVAMETVGSCRGRRTARCQVTALGSLTPARAPQQGGQQLAAIPKTARRNCPKGALLVRGKERRRERNEWRLIHFMNKVIKTTLGVCYGQWWETYSSHLVLSVFLVLKKQTKKLFHVLVF